MLRKTLIILLSTILANSLLISQMTLDLIEFREYPSPITAMVTDDNNLYLSYGDGIQCITADGQILWDTHEYQTHSPLLVTPNLLIQEFKDRGIVALEKSTLEIRWENRDTFSISSFFVSDEENFYFGCSTGDVISMDIETGQQNWVFKAEAKVRCKPVISRGNLVFGDYNGNIYALDPASGTEKARIESDSKVIESKYTLARDNRVFFSSGPAELYMGTFNADDLILFDTANMSIKDVIDNAAEGDFCVQGDHLYFLDKDNRLRDYSMTTRQFQRTRSIPNEMEPFTSVRSSMIQQDNYIVLLGLSEKLLLIDTEEWKILYSDQIGDINNYGDLYSHQLQWLNEIQFALSVDNHLYIYNIAELTNSSRAVVNADGLRVRDHPILEGSTVIDSLNQGEQVNIYGKSDEPVTIGDKTAYWFNIGTDDRQRIGWVFGAFLDFSD